MILTGYLLDAALRRQDLRLDYAIRTGNMNEAKVLVEKLSRLQELNSVYGMVCRVSVKFQDAVQQYTLQEATDRLHMQERTAVGLENLMRAMDPNQLIGNADLAAEHEYAVGLLSALHQAVAEGRANKLDTEVADIECDEAIFA